MDTPQEYLKSISGEDYQLLNRIIIAESGWKINAKNPKSSASGLAQFLDSTFRSQCIDIYKLTYDFAEKNNPYVQIDCLVKMVKDGKISHWNASKHLWQLGTKRDNL